MGKEQKQTPAQQRVDAVLREIAATTPHPYQHIKDLYGHIQSIDEVINLSILAERTGRGLDEILALIKQGYAVSETGAKNIQIVFKVADNGNICMEFSDKLQFLVFTEAGAMEVAQNLINTMAAARAAQAMPRPMPNFEKGTNAGSISDALKPPKATDYPAITDEYGNVMLPAQSTPRGKK